MSAIVELEELISSGIHFGHRVRSWNPKMKKYIFRKRNGIHIIDIKESIKGLVRAKRFIEHVVGQGEDVLFIGTKRQAAALVQQESDSLKMPYVSERWLGGTLTNNTTLRKRLSRLDELDQIRSESGVSLKRSKKEMASLNREWVKIHRNLNGIRHMEKMPGALVIIDINREVNAVLEAKKLGIPVCALVDTDSDPELIDIVVPGNDDALKSITLFLKVISDGVKSGMEKRKAISVAAAAAKEEEAKANVEKEEVKKETASKPTLKTEVAPAEKK